MSNGAIGATGASTAIQAAMIQAVKASGVLVRVEPSAFQTLLTKCDEPLVVMAEGGILRTNYQYLMSYKGLAFFTKSAKPLELPMKAEVVAADKIWIPS